MKRLHSFVLVIALSSALAPGNAAAAGAQEQGGVDGAWLVAGAIELVVQSPTEATVNAEFAIDGGSPVTVLFADLPGQRFERLRFEVDGVETEVGAERRSSALLGFVVPGASGSQRLAISYTLVNDLGAAYRYVLPVPEVTPNGAPGAIRVSLQLPAGSPFRGNVFPALSPERGDATGTRWSAEMVAVPAFVHAVFGGGAAQVRMDVVLEWSAIGAALLAFLAGWAWHRRRDVVGTREGAP